VAGADVNDGAAPDIVAAIRGRIFGYVSVLIGRGDGTFLSPLEYHVDDEPAAVVIGDSHGDQKPDIATAKQGDRAGNQDIGSVTVLLGQGNGGFGSRTEYIVGNGVVCALLATAPAPFRRRWTLPWRGGPTALRSRT
jgi:hypothetical protein